MLPSRKLERSPSATPSPPPPDAPLMAVKGSNKGKHVARPSRQNLSWVEEGRGRLYPQVTIDMLPNDMLLEIFECYLGKDDADEFGYGHNYDGWQTLEHVCRRWRRVVFASPRRLDLKLFCTRQRSVNSKTLDIWPVLPIVIAAKNIQSNEDFTNIIAALRHHNRVCKIYYSNVQFQDSLLKEFAALDEPFPALTSLELYTVQQQNIPVLPDSFLGGSAPRLRSLHLDGIPYPSIGNLLSSTTNLVRLSLCRIPHSGYIPPETIVPYLSTLAKLKSLVLQFQHPRSHVDPVSRHLPPPIRVALHNLTSFHFRGDIEYLEDVLCQIETPMLDQSYFRFFNQLIFVTPLLGHFIRRTRTFTTIHRARGEFFSWGVAVTFWERAGMANNNGEEALRLEISCQPLDEQLSALAQILKSFLSSLLTLESLEIAISREDWQGGIEAIQWQEFLQPFTSVKQMTLVREVSVRFVAPALQELAGQRATEVLPGLQNLFLRTYGRQPSGPVKEAIAQFVTTRRLYGQPVTVHY